MFPDYEEVRTNRSLTLSEVRFMKILILFAVLALMLPIAAEGEESVPIHTWNRGLTVTPNTLYQYFGFCSGPDCARMSKPASLGSAPFSVIPYISIKKTFHSQNAVCDARRKRIRHLERVGGFCGTGPEQAIA